MKDLIKFKSRVYEKNYLKKLKRPDDSESILMSLRYLLPTLDVGKWKGGGSCQIYRLC